MGKLGVISAVRRMALPALRQRPSIVCLSLDIRSPMARKLLRVRVGVVCCSIHSLDIEQPSTRTSISHSRRQARTMAVVHFASPSHGPLGLWLQLQVRTAIRVQPGARFEEVTCTKHLAKRLRTGQMPNGHRSMDTFSATGEVYGWVPNAGKP